MGESVTCYRETFSVDRLSFSMETVLLAMDTSSTCNGPSLIGDSIFLGFPSFS